ncbi:MAG TPA: hypothetical protein VFO10_18030 [Oligoflexus sp.]|uniref:hypothetical protein n=1 Tax=Oligoflexus sp. TaxID=1971216 RepID=UPI002D7F1553|nr:hypothetical protein [Oligoflexus sp.]HET9239164.1 hypothetical protein [Oligoflexus sp.]
MSATVKKQIFFDQQKLVDNAFRPSSELFRTNLELYLVEWHEYLLETEKCVNAFKKELDYYQTLAEQDASSSRKMKLASARTTLSKVAKEYNDLNGGFAPHFHDAFAGFKSRHHKFSQILSSMKVSSPKAFSESLEVVSKKLPRELIEEMKQLPYRHPATLFLKLSSAQYEELNRAAIKATSVKSSEFEAPVLLRLLSWSLPGSSAMALTSDQRTKRKPSDSASKPC